MKTRTLILTVLTLTTICGLTSCTSIAIGLYGIKNYQTVDEKTILQYSKKYNIPITDSYELDTSYITYLSSFDNSRYKEQRKNHNQPLQALYYDNRGQLNSFQINCYAGGFPNLMWNRNGIMKTFPPKQQAPLDSIIQLDMHLKYIQPLSQTKEFSTDDFDYIVIVHWNRFMGRQSKRLIRFVQHNSKLAEDQKVKIIYANNDNIFSIPAHASSNTHHNESSKK